MLPRLSSIVNNVKDKLTKNILYQAYAKMRGVWLEEKEQASAIELEVNQIYEDKQAELKKAVKDQQQKIRGLDGDLKTLNAELQSAKIAKQAQDERIKQKAKQANSSKQVNTSNQAAHSSDDESTSEELIDIVSIEYDISNLQSSIEKEKEDLEELQEIKIDINEIKIQVKEKYCQIFTEKVWQKEKYEERYELIFNEQFDRFKPEAILSKLLERHDWLKVGLNDEEDDDLLEGFIDEFLMAQYEQCLSSPVLSIKENIEKNTSTVVAGVKIGAAMVKGVVQGDIASGLAQVEQTFDELKKWRGLFAGISINDWRKAEFKWDEIRDSETRVAIESYPLSDVDVHYIKRERSSFESVRSHHSEKAETLASHRLSRLDVLRFLYFFDKRRIALEKLKIAPMESKKLSDGIYCTKMAPFHIDELNNLSEAQWGHFETLVINLNSEENPYWIILYKLKNNFVAFVPEEKTLFNSKYEELLKTKISQTIQIMPVNYDVNKNYNNISDMADAEIWHAVLFARVLPYLYEGKNAGLINYRNTIPVSILLQYVWINVTEYESYQVFLTAFSNREPFSNSTLWQYLATAPKKISSIKHLVVGGEEHYAAHDIVQAFDKSEIIITPERSELLLTNASLLLKALRIIYHNNNISRFNLPNDATENFTYDSNELFNYNSNLRSISITGRTSATERYEFSYPMHCAARNRFLDEINPEFMKMTEKDVDKRKALWVQAGLEIVQFFQNKGNEVDLDKINNLIKYNDEWKQNYCDHEYSSFDKGVVWQFAQMAQMGVDGLNAMFVHLNEHYNKKWNYVYKTPAPNLFATFDLSGSLTDKPNEYINCLADNIERFSHDCHPLFKSFALIMPKIISEQVETKLLELLGILQDRHENHGEDSAEILLHNLNIDVVSSTNLINKLHIMANNGLRVLVRIPEWDRAVYEKPEQRELKAKYKALQNKILDNKRIANCKPLMEDVKQIHQVRDEKKLPDIILDNKLSKMPQKFEGEDKRYPLIAKVPGLQQQQQEQVAEQFQQEHEQEQEHQQAPEKEEEQVVTDYDGDESKLITRHNFNDKCKDSWKLLSPSTRKQSGYASDDITNLFSMWVGSECDAGDVIRKVEPSAIEKIMTFAPQFRLGLSRDNLPAGFRLKYSRKSDSLILCFSDVDENQDLVKREKKLFNERNPFTVKLHVPLAPKIMRGDYRQFGLIVVEQKEQQTLWKYLATEDDDQKRIANLQKMFEGDGANHSVIEQHFNVAAEKQQPNGYDRSLAILHAYAIRRKAKPELINLLFDKKSQHVLTETQLKAFGQLFNQFSAQKTTPNGIDNWLIVSNEIYKAFGEKHFLIWKSRFLDVSSNWCEWLTKQEVDAVADSIAILKDNVSYQSIWWSLVDMHGQAAGHMQFEQLWFGFKKVINYIEKNKLQLSQASVFEYITSTPNFNANVFLDRLFFVLRNAENQLDHHGVQQSILNNIANVSWEHNGFYYASRYQNIKYWHANLKLANFIPANQNDTATYAVKWDGNPKVISPALHALRYIAEHAQLKRDDFLKFDKLINECLDLTSINPSTLRLLSAFVTIGIDSLSKIESAHVANLATLSKEQVEVVEWINNQYALDDKIEPGHLQLSLQDLPMLSHFIAKIGINKVDEKLAHSNPALIETSEKYKRRIINACGRAAQCYRNRSYFGKFNKGNLESDFSSYLKLLLSEDSGDRERMSLMSFPWFIHEELKTEIVEINVFACVAAKYEVDTIVEQLASIDFSLSKYLPSSKDINEALLAISKSNAPRAVRDKYISFWKEKGCEFTLLFAPYRKLKTEEIDNLLKYIDVHLKGNYKKINASLFEKLAKRLAVKVDGQPERCLEDLFKLFIRLDNKLHYNELGPIIGILVLYSKPNRYYSVVQLCTWLEALIDSKKAQETHYPVLFLKTILENVKDDKDFGLISGDLNKLDDNAHSISKKRRINEIVILSLQNQHKSVLVEMALKAKSVNDYEFLDLAIKLLVDMRVAKASNRWIEAIINILKTSLNPNVNQNVISMTIEHLAKPWKANTKEDSNNQLLIKLWEESQIQLIELFSKGIIDAYTISSQFSVVIDKAYKYNSDSYVLDVIESVNMTRCYIKLILTQSIKYLLDDANNSVNSPGAMSHSPSQRNIMIYQLSQSLSTFDENELKLLAEYYATDPRPTLGKLHYLVVTRNLKTTNDIVHYFETITQAKGDDNRPKGIRHYSVTPEDKSKLLRVLSGIRLKFKEAIDVSETNLLLNQTYFINSYSEAMQLHAVSMDKLKGYLSQSLSEHKANRHDKGNYATAKLLACMREILLRKSGMWINHTQMLDLLYAAMHNKDSIIHQVRTGEGKSIITIMRAAYLALDGCVVDVFSAKDSLSRRDHDEFASVLDAMGIQHAYVSSSSDESVYKTASDNGVGAINYATMGNLSLYLSKHTWEQNKSINVENNNRVAFIDEADHVLLDDQTQFNYSDHDGDAIYNLDEWVYNVAYEFYVEHRDEFERDPHTGHLYITRSLHLSKLCEKLQQRIGHGHPQSTFFDQHIIPALNDDNVEAIKKRDQMLVKLLSAAHVACSLEVDKNYCVRPDTRQVNDGALIDINYAKVLIKNQIQHHSSYSELVQQFLHVRLNYEAAKKGEEPNFFVEPQSQIALSLNSQYLLKDRYGKIEGCTGTAGNREQLNKLEAIYHIDHVVKLPKHEVSKTNYSPWIFADNEAEQVKAIVGEIKNNIGLPILIACEDDTQVKVFSEIVSAQLDDYVKSKINIIVDTNDSGRSEKEMVPFAGKPNAKTFSSRMGRGTDIKPEKNKPLYVLGIHSASLNVVKQEFGRTGRNGNDGKAGRIVNYGNIRQQYDRDCHYGSRLAEIMEWQTRHLRSKLAKHAKHDSSKWSWLVDNKQLQEKYLITLSVQQLNDENKLQSQLFMRRKEALCATLSGYIENILRQYMQRNDKVMHDSLRNRWLNCLKNIEALWDTRLVGQKGESKEVFQSFFDKANSCWQNLCKDLAGLDYKLLKNFNQPVSVGNMHTSEIDTDVDDDDLAKVEAENDRDSITPFYQQYLIGAEKYYPVYSAMLNSQPTMHKVIYGDSLNGLTRLYSVIRGYSIYNNSLPIGQEPQHLRRRKLFSTLQTVMGHSSGFTVSCTDLATTITLLMKALNDDQDIFYNQCLIRFFSQSWLKSMKVNRLKEKDVHVIGQLLILFTKMSMQHIVNDKTMLDSIDIIGSVIKENFWDKFNAAFNHDLYTIFLQDDYKPAAEILLTSTNSEDLGRLFELCYQSREGRGKDNHDRRLHTVLSYLTLHKDELTINKAPSVIRSVFELLVNDNFDVSAENLPSPMALKSFVDNKYLGQDSHGTFWYFINRRPFSQNSCQKIIEILNSITIDRRACQQIIEPLFALPDSIPLDYIVNHIKHAPGRFNYDDCQERLAELKQAGDAFNAFLKSSKIDNLQPWLGRFNKLSPGQNCEFFLLMKRCASIPSAILGPIVQQYDDGKLALGSTLNDKLEAEAMPASLASIFNKNYPDCKADEVLHQLTAANLSLEEINENSQRFLQFVSYFNKPEYSSLGSTVPKLFKAFCVDKKLQNFNKVIEAIKTLQDAEELMENKFRTNVFAVDASLRQRIMQYLEHDLIDLGDKLKQDKLKQDEFKQNCKRAYANFTKNTLQPKPKQDAVAEKTWRYRHHLQKVTKFAYEAANVALYPGQELPRPAPMKFFESALPVTAEEIKAATAKTKEALAKAQADAKTEASNVEAKKREVQAAKTEPVEHQAAIREMLAAINASHAAKTKEAVAEAEAKKIEEIAAEANNKQSFKAYFFGLFKMDSLPVLASPWLSNLIMKAAGLDKPEYALKGYAKSIVEQLGSYTGFGMWLTTNTTRKEQFNTLMKGLVATAAAGDANPKYMAMLTVIWKVQKNILNEDKDVTWNGKGYSRLYDLTLEMFTKISRDMMMDENVSAQDKQALYLLMGEQSSRHLRELCERLPTCDLKDKLKQFATRYQGESLDMVELKELLFSKEAKKKHIPSHLHYLINNLLYSAELVIEQPEELKKLVKQLG